jgi:hypothetical protein
LTSRYEDKTYEMLSDEPVTPNEVAKKLGINFKITGLRAGCTYSGEGF